jgi:GT2 family glycosyltransferase
MKILVIIVSYNFMPWIDRCLGSLRKLDEPVDVMVVDNHSQDDTVSTIRKHYPEVRLMENKENLGFGRANNMGINYAVKEDYEGVLLLNQDAWIDDNTITGLVNVARRHTEFGILSPIHLTGNGDRIEHGFSDYTGLTSLDNLPSEEVMEVGFINAAIWYMPMRALRAVGGFAPLFYHYGEDKDLANRMRHHGWKIGYLPEVFGYHDREFRVETRKRFLHSEYVYHLTEYANINYGLGKAFSMGVLAVFKKIITSAAQAKWNDAAAYLSMSGRLLGKTCAVVRTRQMSKHVVLSHYL